MNPDNQQQPSGDTTTDPTQPPQQPIAPVVSSLDAPSPQPQPSQPAPQAPVGEDPGKGLAIAGIILAFFAQLIGLILSIIARKKSKAAGFDGKLATIGIVLNTIFLVLGTILTALIFISITMVAYSGIQQRGATSIAQSTASAIIKKAEVYSVEKGTYPSSIADFETAYGSSLAEYRTDISSSPITSRSDKVAIYTCGTDGVKVEYWNSTTDTAVADYSGLANTSSSCTLVR